MSRSNLHNIKSFRKLMFGLERLRISLYLSDGGLQAVIQSPLNLLTNCMNECRSCQLTPPEFFMSCRDKRKKIVS